MASPYVFLNGQFLPLSEAKVGIRTHALHYGTGVFEGIRANWNPEEQKLFLFRPAEHYQRLLRGCQVLKIRLPYSAEELTRITVELVERNGYQEDLYVRPLAFKGAEKIGVLKLHDLEDSFAIIVIPFGSYLQTDVAARLCVSSWRRVDDNMIPPRLKVTGLYINSALAKTEAVLNGFDEAILLNADGHVSEGSGENIFLVMEGVLVTPSISDNILQGITRDTVIQLARNELGVETVERTISRTELYTAQECFLTGTAAHITPVGEIDHRPIGDGQVGSVTRQLQALFFDIVKGKNPKYVHWCTPVVPKLVKA